MRMQLRGKHAVITGGGRGIGAEIARVLHGAGAQVLVTARSKHQIEAVAAELGGSEQGAFAVECDVTKPDSILAMADAAKGLMKHVDILVNNAGVASSAPLRSLDLAEWERLWISTALNPSEKPMTLNTVSLPKPLTSLGRKLCLSLR